MTHPHRSWKIFLTGIGLTLLLAGLTPFLIVAQDDEPTLPPDEESFRVEPTLPPDEESFRIEPTLPPDEESFRVEPTLPPDEESFEEDSPAQTDDEAEPTAAPTQTRTPSETPTTAPTLTDAPSETPTADASAAPTTASTPEVEAAVDTAAPAADATPGVVYTADGAAVTISGSNSYCLVCHNQPWRAVTLSDGSIHNLYVNPNAIAASVHGTSSSAGAFGCVDCHGENAFPHLAPAPDDARLYTLDAVAICANCHEDEHRELQDGLHQQAIAAGNRSAAVCTDCHGAHDVAPVVEEPELIAGVCGDCHTTTLTEWRVSAHADIGPLGCATCHSPHSQQLREGDNADALCMNCHDDVSDVFVHQQHLEGDSPVSCVDCHMHTPTHDQTTVLVAADASTGHSMQLETRTCNTCHEQLVASGEWTRLVAAADAASVPTTDHAAAPASTAETSGLVQLLQGLILGLGLGATVTAVFVARGRPTPPSAPAAAPQPAAPETTTPAATDTAPVGDGTSGNTPDGTPDGNTDQTKEADDDPSAP